MGRVNLGILVAGVSAYLFPIAESRAAHEYLPTVSQNYQEQPQPYVPLPKENLSVTYRDIIGWRKSKVLSPPCRDEDKKEDSPENGHNNDRSEKERLLGYGRHLSRQQMGMKLH